MTTAPGNTIRTRVVTLATLDIPVEPERVGRGGEVPPPAAMRHERFLQIRERVRQQTRHIGRGVLITVPDREVSLLQSAIARDGQRGADLGGGAVEVKFGTGLGGGDVAGWMRSVFDWVDRRQAHSIVRPATAAAGRIPDRARIAMTADWGTGLYGAPLIAGQISRMGGFDVLLHLGDVYYSGTPEEMQERFLDVWPLEAGAISRALNANHEMYSGGFGYFELALPALGQEASYFALQNEWWLLVGLDTAYVDHDLDNQQVAWLNAVVRQAAGRRVLLFSHHQLFSPFDEQGYRLERAVRHLLEARAITAWYWGHEHQCVVYDAHPQYGLLGRCLGNGGVPELRLRIVRDAPVQSATGAVSWKRLPASAHAPACTVLDGPNADIPGHEEAFVPHGFMTLELDGPRLTERVFLSSGEEILRKRVA